MKKTTNFDWCSVATLKNPQILFGVSGLLVLVDVVGILSVYIFHQFSSPPGTSPDQEKVGLQGM